MSSFTSCRQLPCIQIPLTPNQTLVSRLTTLKNDLLVWGFTEDLDAFTQTFKAKHARANDGGAGERALWVEETQRWLNRGDDILDEIQGVVTSGILESLAPRHMGRLWEQLSASAFKVQYMMVFANVYVDLGM
ncbi:hypothetical protein C2E23DRAFT_743647 [Lenzites betulinus]|nr:hypothetical protein C2E23DRAFT_743647 [Lenzites betulinus]